MNCFPCFSSQKSKKESSSIKDHDFSFDQHPKPTLLDIENKEAPGAPADYGNNSSIKAFNFRELASATKNFRQECLLGEGGLGKVYKGSLKDTGQEVAVKQLDRNAMEGNNEFFVEVGPLSLLQHPNLVSLIGYCADGDQRLLVYEFMSGGSVEDHLHDMKAGEKSLDWVTRMKIAYGAAQGLQYLHEKVKPPIIYRDLKSSKVLLDDQFNPKLSNIGFDKLGSSADSKMPMQSRMMDNHGYNAPEYTKSGTITTMTDVYSFGVVLLELITGRKPIDTSKPEDQQNLVAWAQPIFKEPKHFPEMADPLLKKRFPERGLNQAVAIAAMCVQEEAAARPLISDLASVLSFLSIATEENNIPATLPPSISSKLHCISEKLQFLDCTDQAAGKMKVQESTVNAADVDNNDEGSSSSARSSSVEKSCLTQQHSRRSTDGNGNRSLSQKSSGRSLFSLGNDSGRAHSLSSKKSKKSQNNASFSSRDEDDGGKSAASLSQKSNSDLSDIGSSDESASSSNEKTGKKLQDESGNNVSQKGSLGHKSSKKLSDKISKSRKSSKMKKSKDESGSTRHRSSSSKKSNDESLCSASMKKSHQKSKKRNNDDDSPGDSQSEN